MNDETQRHGDEAGRHEDEASSGSSDEQLRRETLERLRQLRVADLVEEMLIGLVTVGYQKLGLTDQTRELRDLGEARLVIETLRAWLDVLARERGEEGLADLRSTVAAMQLSYARAAAEPAPGAEPVDGDGAASGAGATATDDAVTDAGTEPQAEDARADDVAPPETPAG